MPSSNISRVRLPKFHCIDLDKISEKYGQLSVEEVFERVDEKYSFTFANILQGFKLNT
jgi:hypothetical protein